MLADILAYIPSIVGILIISSIVYLRNRSYLFKLFTLVTSLIAIWLFFQFLTETTLNTHFALLMLRLATIAPNFLSTAFLLFAHEYAGKILSRREYVMLLCPPLLITPLSFTPLIIKGIEPAGISFTTSVGGLYAVQTVFLLIYFSYGSILIFKTYKRQVGLQKIQTRLILVSFLLPVVAVFITNFIFVSSALAQFLSPLAFLAMVITQAYAIVKHRLFDIRLVVARSLAYILSLGTASGLFVLLTFVLFASLFGTGGLSFLQQITYVGVATLLSLSYAPLKRFFDRTTNKMFFRDAYEPQLLLDQLNQVLVSTIELEALLEKSSKVITEVIKSEFCLFSINKINNKPRRLIGENHKELISFDIDNEYILHNKEKLTIADEIDDSHSNLRNDFQKNNIALLVRLKDSPNKSGRGLGYIILGAKKSGNPYSSQDTKMLEIIADELVIAIQNALRFEEIQNFAKTLQEKVDDATRQLRQTNEKLKQMDQTKDDFISMASHQLRTPLTSVKGYVSMVMEGDAGKITAQQRKLLDQAFISSQRMVYLIADLLNVSRLRTGKFIIEAKPTNLADVVEGEISQLIETAKGRDLELTYKKPKDFPMLMLDDTKIRQVIMNFADNAIYYTPAGGHIRVGLEDKGDTIEFTVTDDGIGVPKSEQHHLFGKFYRAGNAKKARPDGTGLGLFMAKKVIIAQGGAIIFHTQEGKGSTFGFSFAKAPLLPSHYKGAVSENAVK